MYYSSGSFRHTSSSERDGHSHLERFPSQIEDEFDEIAEVIEEYDNAPLFQRIHITGEDTAGVGYHNNFQPLLC